MFTEMHQNHASILIYAHIRKLGIAFIISRTCGESKGGKRLNVENGLTFNSRIIRQTVGINFMSIFDNFIINFGALF